MTDDNILMAQTLNIDGNEYEVEKLSDNAKAKLASLHFANERIRDLKNMLALLQKAKQGYVTDLKREVLSNKSGFFLDDD